MEPPMRLAFWLGALWGVALLAGLMLDNDHTTWTHRTNLAYNVMRVSYAVMAVSAVAFFVLTFTSMIRGQL